MVDEHRIRTNRLSGTFRVSREATRAVREAASLPRVVWSWRGDDDFRSLRDNCLSSINEVRRVSEYRLRYAIVGSLASLRASTRTVRSPIIIRKRAAVIVAELNNYDIPRLYSIYDSIKSAFSSVGACATSTNCFVVDGKTEGVGKVDTPS